MNQLSVPTFLDLRRPHFPMRKPIRTCLWAEIHSQASWENQKRPISVAIRFASRYRRLTIHSATLSVVEKRPNDSHSSGSRRGPSIEKPHDWDMVCEHICFDERKKRKIDTRTFY